MRKVTAVFSKTLTYLFLLIVAVFAVFPVIYILLGSFKSNTEILVGGVDLLPKKWLFSNYEQAWTLARFGSLTMNSIFYSACVVVGSIITCITAGYVLSGEKHGLSRLFIRWCCVLCLSPSVRCRCIRSFSWQRCSI